MNTANNVILDIEKDIEAIAKEVLNADGEQLARFGRDVREYLRKSYGGQTIYFKKTIDHISRDHELFDNFDGGNVAELAIKYDLSMQSVYKIVKAVRLSRKNKTEYTGAYRS